MCNGLASLSNMRLNPELKPCRLTQTVTSINDERHTVHDDQDGLSGRHPSHGYGVFSMKSHRSILFVWPVLLFMLAALPSSTFAWWYSTDVKKGADIIVDEVRWPHWPQGTYFALWNTHPYPKGGYIYGGIAPLGPTDQHRRELVWTFWGGSAYGSDRPTVVALSDHTLGGPMFGEGASASIVGDMDMLQPARWYRMVMRSWQDLDDPEHVGYMGWWMKDLEADRWYEVGVVRLPTKVTGFDGQSCFVEVIGPPGLRQIDRRVGFYRYGNQWHPAARIFQKPHFAATCNWQPIEDGTALRFSNVPHDPDQKPDVDPETEMVYYDFPKVPQQLEFEPPVVEDLVAQQAGDDLLISWSIPESSPPQLGYKIEALDASGKRVLAEVRALEPNAQTVRLTVHAPAQQVRLTMRDIYDQSVTLESAVTSVPKISASTVSDLEPGVHVAYYQTPAGQSWQSLPDFDKLQPRFSGYVRKLSDSVAGTSNKNHAIVFNGFLRVPETGFYVFDLRSNDGSRLSINGQVVINHDGLHSASSRRGGIALEAGEHPFELAYFKGEKHWATERLEHQLWLGWEGPGFTMRQVSPDALFCKPAAGTPSFDLQIEARPNDWVRMTPNMRSQDHKPSRVDFYAGERRLGSITGQDEDMSFSQLLPEGENQLWARLWFDQGQSMVDSAVQTVDVRLSSTEDWQVARIGEKWPAGARITPNEISLMGDGVLFAYQPVEGDFTITARLEDVSRTTEQNGISKLSRFGLLVLESPDRNSINDFAIWQTAGEGMRGTASDRDLETSRRSRWVVSENQPWVRIVRRGNHYQAYTSPDGRNWSLAIDRVKRQLPKTLYVGVAIDVPPHYNKTLFQGTATEIRIDQPGMDIAPQPAVMPEMKQGQAVTIIRGSAENPRMYLRTFGQGVYVSSDQGRTWQMMKLPEDAKWVRSLAVHPKQHDTLLLAAGSTDDQGRLSSGLWRSENAGQSWVLVTDRISFRGDLPSVVGGEVISFNPHDPNRVVAGGHEDGVFLSQDGGKTWNPSSLVDASVNVVLFSPRKNLLLVGTSGSDQWGLPASSTPARLYSSSDSGETFRVDFERPDLAINNLAFQDMIEGEEYLYFATTQGVYYCFNLSRFYQYRYRIMPDSNYTAVTSHPTEPQRSSQVYAAPLNTSDGPTLYTGKIGYYWSMEWDPVNSTPALHRVTGLAWSGPSKAPTLLLCNDQGVWASDDQGQSFQCVWPTP